jgi:cell division protease FtsH
MRRVLVDVATSLGGRIAEEQVLGDISNGASGDIKYVTKLVRHMVCDWGMSPLGPISFADNQDTVFLGRDITRQEHISEDTARKIDAEVQRIISEQYVRASSIIREKRDALDKIAAALIEYETIEGKHVLEILQFGEIRTPVVRMSPPPADKGGDKLPSEKPSAEPPQITPAPAANPA